MIKPGACIEKQAREAEWRSAFGIGDDTPIVVMVGRLWEQKTPLCLVELADLLLKSGSVAKFSFLATEN